MSLPLSSLHSSLVMTPSAIKHTSVLAQLKLHKFWQIFLDGLRRIASPGNAPQRYQKECTIRSCMSLLKVRMQTRIVGRMKPRVPHSALSSPALSSANIQQSSSVEERHTQQAMSVSQCQAHQPSHIIFSSHPAQQTHRRPQSPLEQDKPLYRLICSPYQRRLCS